MNTSPHPAVAAIRSFLEPWRPAIAEIVERPYSEVHPDDVSGDNHPDDIIVNVRPKNERPSPLEFIVYATETDRTDIALDRWSHLATLLGVEASLSTRGIDYYVVSLGWYATIDTAKDIIHAVARGDVIVKASVIRRRIRGTSVLLVLPTGEIKKGGVGGITGAKWLSYVGLAEVKTYRYEPWTT